MIINGTTVTERGNRPGVLEKVALRILFLNNGIFVNPYQVSSVAIYALSSNGSPSSVLGSDNLLAGVTPLMYFANSATAASDVSFSTSNYSPGNTASGIFKLATGDFCVVLDGGAALSGEFNGSAMQNGASSVGDYIDVWTVRMFQNGSWATFINQFHLYNDNIFTVTEPLLLSTKTKLFPKEIVFGSKEDLRVNCEFTIANRSIGPELKNIFRDTVITDAQIKIVKINEGTANLPGHVTVSSFANTSALLSVTQDNTIILSLDTNLLATHSETLAGNLGSLTGVYAVQAKFSVLNQTFVSPLMYFQVV